MVEAHPSRREMVEFRGVLVHPAIVDRLTQLLAHHDAVRLSSGWRSVVHNREVGGVPRSRHLWGAAVDVVGPNGILAHLGKSALRYGAVEVVYEGDHLHIGWPRPGG